MRIKDFPDGSYLEFAPGKFDEWCVYMVNPNKGVRKPPLDSEYFGFLKAKSTIFGVDKIYADFVTIYEQTGREISSEVLAQIDEIVSNGYGEQWLNFSKVYTILYMAMIAEDKKAHTRLGKRIKRLGIYTLLIEDYPVERAANFMRNMGWKEIDTLCRERGF